MANPTKRLMKEIRDVQMDAQGTQINVQTVEGDLSRLKGKFPGPPNSPYEGGTFEVSIDIPPRYPFEPLKMQFITKVYHPNISSQSGAICLDILKDAWSPVLTLKTTLVSLQSLLCSPEPLDPQDAEVAKVYLQDKAAFEQTARYWTEIYASGKDDEPELQPTNHSSSSNSSGTASYNSTTVVSAKTGGVDAVGGGRQSKALKDHEILASGLNPAYVRQFEAMGFSTQDIVRVMMELDYRGLNVVEIGEEAVVEALLES